MDKNEINFTQLQDLINKSSIQPTSEQVAKVRLWLQTFFKDVGFEGDINKRVEEILDKAYKGWPRAPKSFVSRVSCAVGNRTIDKWRKDKLAKQERQAKGLSDDDAMDEFVEKDMASAFENISVYGDSVYDFLSDDEKLYWKKREGEYRKEFEFNESSDKVLLEEVIYLEVLLRRVRKAKLTGEGLELIKGYSEADIIDEHKKLLEKLGILRLQRIQADQNIEGNVGEISLALEEKLEDIRKLKDEKAYNKTISRINEKFKHLTMQEIHDTIEELSLLREVQRMPTLNAIPSAVMSAMTQKIKQNDDEKLKDLEVLIDG